MEFPKISPATRIALFYCVAAVTWIVGSDWIASMVVGDDRARWSGVQTFKGLLFVGLMTVALYVLVDRLHRVQKRNRQVEAMLRVSERLETVGSLAASLVHDLNNMLAVIRGFTELAKLEHGTEGNVRRERLADIEGAVVRANTMVSQLSCFLQHAPGDVSLIHPGAVLRELEPLLQQAATRRVDFSLHIEEPMPPLAVDRGRLEQALLNLVVNARDAMEGLEHRALSITASACELRKHTSPQHPRPASGRFVRIRVVDTGRGIPPEHQVRVFEPFFTTKAAGQGTGLGLPSVLSMAKHHGGWVELHSAPGRGATFDVYLPTAIVPPAIVS